LSVQSDSLSTSLHISRDLTQSNLNQIPEMVSQIGQLARDEMYALNNTVTDIVQGILGSGRACGVDWEIWKGMLGLLGWLGGRICGGMVFVLFLGVRALNT
jgi:hypothetical protein